MRIGMLSRQITFQTQSAAQDETGGTLGDPTWTDFATTWASFKPMIGKEVYVSNEFNAQIDAIFRIRYREDISDKMAINFKGNLYDIFSIREIGQREGLEIAAKARAVA